MERIAYLRMRNLLLALSIVCALLPVRAAVAQTDLQTHQAKLGSLTELAGSCWSGKFPNGAIDTHCWDWAIQGRFLRDRHTVESEAGLYSGETLYGWDAGAEVVTFWYFNSLGGFSEGTVVAIGEQLLIKEDYSDAAQETEMRSNLEVDAPERYVILTESLTDTGWETFLSLSYERVDRDSTRVEPVED